MITSLITRIIGSRNTRVLRKLQKTVDRINGLESVIEKLPMNNCSKNLRILKAHTGGNSMLLPEAFAVVREASRRVFAKRHFDVQLIIGVVLHQNKIAEMKTGEGKTLTATCPTWMRWHKRCTYHHGQRLSSWSWCPVESSFIWIFGFDSCM